MEMITLCHKKDVYLEISGCLEKWCETNRLMNADTMLSLYHEQSVLLGTFAPKMCTTHAQIHDYFSQLYSGDKSYFDVTLTQKLIYEQNSIVFTTGEYLFSWQCKEVNEQVPARFTFVYANIGNQWKIFHHHSSVLPQ
jgi:hypothetical protein